MSNDPARGFLAAICAASAVPALPFGAASPALGVVIFMAAFFVAAAHVAVFGLPLYHLMSRQGPPGVIAALIGGLAVGALPSVVLIFVMDPSSGALLGDPELLKGFEQRAAYFIMPLAFGISGLAGGLAFWAVALRRADD
jgi:hypothetical protein